MGRLQKFASFAAIPLAALFVAALVAALGWLSASATTEDDCILDLGSWTPNPLSPFPEDFGTCTYSANSNMAISNCGADMDYSVTYHEDESVTDGCTAVSPASPGSSGGNSDPSGCRTEVRGPLETIVTLALCHGKNGAATFPIGVCEIKCSITNGLPDPAARKLPKTAVATMYVRTVPNNDPYTVCFFIDPDLGLDPPTIYRFIGGTWVAVAVGSPDAGVICATGSGEGSFCLGEPTKKKSE